MKKGISWNEQDHAIETFIYELILCSLQRTMEGYDMTEASRPLDALNAARGKKVIVDLKNNKQFIGALKAFDIHINIVLDNTEEHVDGQVTRKLGTCFVRGDTIIMISPA